MKWVVRFRLQAAALAALALVPARGAAQSPGYAVLHSFQGGADGAEPQGGVILGKDGSLYGTTIAGGAGNTSECNVNGTYYCGTVFKLVPLGDGTWANTVIFDFDGPDGGGPGSSLVFGDHGALYGTTEVGGSGDGGGNKGNGTVFQLLPPATGSGAWTETVLYGFPGGYNNERILYAGVIIGPGGALFGTTWDSVFDHDGPDNQSNGGGFGFPTGGSVFMVSPPTEPGGTWTESMILNFNGSSLGLNPWGGVVAAGGSLYGTTYFTITYEPSCGVVYELTPPATPGAAWTGTVIHSFGGPPNDGCNSQASLTVGPGGVLYGATIGGGSATGCDINASGCGAVFQLTPPATSGGAWTESIIHNFTTSNGDGLYPSSTLVLGKNGALYGTTRGGGSATSGSPCIWYFGGSGCGTVFQLSPPATPGGAWTETILYSFTGENGDGSDPGPVTLSPNGGILYGTTSTGGTAGFGTVYAITLSGRDDPKQ